MRISLKKIWKKFVMNLKISRSNKVPPLEVGENIDDYALKLSGGSTTIAHDALNLANHGVQVDWNDMISYILARKNITSSSAEVISKIIKKYNNRNNAFREVRVAENKRYNKLRQRAVAAALSAK